MTPPTVPPTIADPRRPPSPPARSGDVRGRSSRGRCSTAAPARSPAPPTGKATSSTESMIKAWIVSDFLRRSADGEPSTALKQARPASRSGTVTTTRPARSTALAARTPSRRAATGPVIKRAISICGLTNTKRGNVPELRRLLEFHPDVRPGRRPARRLRRRRQGGRPQVDHVGAQRDDARCAAPPPPRTSSHQSGGGRWGIIDGLPESILAQAPVSIKNGWTRCTTTATGTSTASPSPGTGCLAVMTRYPIRAG